MNPFKVIDFLFYTCMVFLCVFLIIILASSPSDRRPFKDIVEQCESMGYIQDNVTRIKCSVEK